MSDKPKRKINASRMAEDIRAGLSDSELMGKYGLSERQLPIVIRKLIDAGLVTDSDIEARPVPQVLNGPTEERSPRSAPVDRLMGQLAEPGSTPPSLQKSVVPAQRSRFLAALIAAGLSIIVAAVLIWLVLPEFWDRLPGRATDSVPSNRPVPERRKAPRPAKKPLATSPIVAAALDGAPG